MSERIEILRQNLMIRASAGSGKTYQLGNRVIGLVGVGEVDPERIVALTFTRKAAGEFADSVLRKLARAAGEPKAAAELAGQIGAEFDPAAVLERVVRALPRFQLGTIDGFFTRVVRGFQHELGLGGGGFELVQGPKLEALLLDLRAAILLDALEGRAGEEFLHAFRRATMGREENRVSEPLADFVAAWHGWWLKGVGSGAFGGGFEGLPEPAEWERRRALLAGALREAVAGTEWTDKRQPGAMEKLLEKIEGHHVGSGSLGGSGKLFESLLAGVAGEGPLRPSHYREFELGAEASEAFRATLGLLVKCELAAAVERTRAIGELVARYDAECERRLRRRGLLGFDDVKRLMGAWTRSEEERLRREQVDFRLDARYDHWLLDEFQDTSRAEWTALEPLADEAVAPGAGSFFVVGDEKQAIYGWRGGEVRLFEELEAKYGGGRGEEALRVQSMPTSYRSCEAVLELVNAVCGDLETIRSLFGERVASRWRWEDHVAARKGIAGEARVEVVEGDAEARCARLIELLDELGVRERQLSCGVLLRTNAQVRDTAEALRVAGFEVIEEGSRKPTEDNPVGVTLRHLIRWLADPADRFARRVLEMSPLGAVVSGRFGESWAAAWEGMLELAREEGFAGLAEVVLEGHREPLSDFGRRRAADVLAALAAFDAAGGGGAREALRWIEGLEVSQSPGVAAVQVMSIHKSKGLGFDLVVLPEIESRQVPDAGRFEVAAGEGWLLQPPARWVRDLVPPLREAEASWGEEQRYEAMCLLYVALTRAKRGLHVFLPAPPKKGWDEGHASAANWLMRSLGGGEDGVLWQSGDRGWIDELDPREAPPPVVAQALGEARPRRARATPSGAKAKVAGGGGSAGGRVYGNAIHAAFERVGWVDEEQPGLEDDEAGRRVAELLRSPEVRAGFERGGRAIELFREQPVEAIVDGKWLSGIIDRLHVIDGGAEVEVIDFKSDAVEEAAELVERYASQMEAYRGVIAGVYPRARVRCRLLSTKLGEWVGVGVSEQ